MLNMLPLKGLLLKKYCTILFRYRFQIIVTHGDTPALNRFPKFLTVFEVTVGNGDGIIIKKKLCGNIFATMSVTLIKKRSCLRVAQIITVPVKPY
jgi:hypothetical protein